MENKRRWRVFFVWGLFIFSLLYCLPTMFGDALPEGYRNVFAKKLNYGLDLQGGLELRYTVDWKKAIEQNGEKLGETIRQAVIDKLITAKSGDNPSDVPLETRREFEAKYGKDIRTEVTEYQTIVVSLGAEVDSLITAEEILEFDPRYGMGSSSTGDG